MRFMPDEVGLWQMNWQFSDGSASGSDTFQVVDDGTQRGPLLQDGRFFADADNDPVNMCGYGQILTFPYPVGYSNGFEYVADQADWIASNGFNLIQVAGTGPITPYSDRTLKLDLMHSYERMLEELQARGIYVLPFRNISQSGFTTIADDDYVNWMKVRLARTGAYWSDIGQSPTWEWSEVTTENRITWFADSWAGLDPFSRLLTAHDSSVASFAPWLGFSSRQIGAIDLFTGHSRTAGSNGGTDPSLTNRPIVGSEDLWYLSPFSQPQTASEIRQGTWNEFLAGIVPILSTWHWTLQLDTPPEILAQYRQACDFVFNETNYRDWDIRSDLQTPQQIVSSTADDSEFIVYAKNGLPEIPAGVYDLHWLNPISGAELIQANITVSGPIQSPLTNGEVVLLARPSN
jgi:hypothetical protein